MRPEQVHLLRYFTKDEKDFAGNHVHWDGYDAKTMIELDRLRHEIRSECYVIRGSHGYLKENAVDAIFPNVAFHSVVMGLFRSSFSKGLYEGGSIHLDPRMGVSGLARCWLAFKPKRKKEIKTLGFDGLYSYTNDGWIYYAWGHDLSWKLLAYLVGLNTDWHKKNLQPPKFLQDCKD